MLVLIVSTGTSVIVKHAFLLYIISKFMLNYTKFMHRFLHEITTRRPCTVFYLRSNYCVTGISNCIPYIKTAISTGCRIIVSSYDYAPEEWQCCGNWGEKTKTHQNGNPVQFWYQNGILLCKNWVQFITDPEYKFCYPQINKSENNYHNYKGFSLFRLLSSYFWAEGNDFEPYTVSNYTHTLSTFYFFLVCGVSHLMNSRNASL